MNESPRRSRALVGLALLGFASAVWAGFLWSELIVSRTGGTPFCAAEGGTGCLQLWDSELARFVHARTGLPVAAWGVVWSILALLFPLLSWVRGAGRDAALRSSLFLTASVGALTVVGLAGTSLAERTLCTGCLGTYVLVSFYAALAYWSRPRETRLISMRGLGGAAAAALVVYLALLYPGLRTPRSAEDLTREALGEHHDLERAAALSASIASLPVPVQETLAGLLHEFSVAPAQGEKPRALVGDPSAPVILTEFSDALCGHCARLHGVLRELEKNLPRGSFALESRQFPLDSACNPNLSREARDEGVRCFAAKLRICLEGNPGLVEFNERMFADQLSLDTERLLELARPYADEKNLLECVASPETQVKLRDDIAYAMRHGIEGTPLVLINGRKGSAFPPFLLAVISAGGDLDHPAFKQLPKLRR